MANYRAKSFESGCYVKPCIAEVQAHNEIVQHETFAPILYLMKYKTLDEAIAIQNGVPQGLSSAIMTLNLREAEQFLSSAGSDCGIANVNIGTSGLKLAEPLGVRKKPVVEEKVVAMPGGFICVGKPTPLTTVQSSLWHKVFGLIYREIIISCYPNPNPYEKINFISVHPMLLSFFKCTIFSSYCCGPAGQFSNTSFFSES